ncbi:MAG: hypothetical protein DRH07_04865 [Deltaproteobacteria bacterium]|nr:MAG: hypothetical protein DRH07_04865 [Deltaproteobacteria bacterium]
MITADVHVCLVSEQLLPNLLPVLDPESRPEKVVLLVTPRMASEAERLSLLLREVGCRSVMKEIRAYRIEDIREVVLKVLAEFSGRKITLNATGGTKIMSLGAAGVFLEFNLPVFYIDSENDSSISLSSPHNSSILRDLLKVETCLKCYGYEIISSGDALLQLFNRNLYQALVDGMERWEKPLGSLNYYAGRAEKSLWTHIDSPKMANHDFLALVELFNQAGHLDCVGNRLIFKDEESRRLVQGGWLEQYVYSLLEDLRRTKKVKDVAVGVVVKNKRGTKNEIDVACTYANRLHVVECKTAQLRGDGKKGDDVVYKLDNLRDLMGGSYGRALLVSYHHLRVEDIKRCQDNNVSVVYGRKLQQLKSNLPLWLEGRFLV